jgi:hypothetical protein
MSEEFVSIPAGNPFVEVSASDAFSTDLWICIEDPFSQKTYVAKHVELVFEEITNRGLRVEPTLRLSGRFGAILLKSLMDKLATRSLALEGEPNIRAEHFKMMEFEARANRAEKEFELAKLQMNEWKERAETAEQKLRQIDPA